MVKEEITVEENTHGIPDESYEAVLCGLSRLFHGIRNDCLSQLIDHDIFQ